MKKYSSIKISIIRLTYVYMCLSILLSCGREKKDAELFFIQGNVAYKNGNYEEASKFYTEAIEKTPKFSDAYNNRGKVRLEMNNIDGAIQDFEKAVSIDDKFYMAKFNLAEAYSNTNKNEESLGLLKQISKPYKDSSFYYVLLSNIFIQKNNFTEANAQLAIALQLNPENDKAYTNLGYIQYINKNYDAAKQNFDKAISLNPKQDFALNNLSLIYAQKEDYKKSLDIIEKAIEINKADIYQNNKAYYLLNIGELKKAKGILDILVEKNKNNPWIYRNLGVFYLKSGNIDSANKVFLKAEEIDPGVELLNYYLGLTQQSLGNNKKACKYWFIGEKLNESKSIQMLTKICK